MGKLPQSKNCHILRFQIYYYQLYECTHISYFGTYEVWTYQFRQHEMPITRAQQAHRKPKNVRLYIIDSTVFDFGDEDIGIQQFGGKQKFMNKCNNNLWNWLINDSGQTLQNEKQLACWIGFFTIIMVTYKILYLYGKTGKR